MSFTHQFQFPIFKQKFIAAASNYHKEEKIFKHMYINNWIEMHFHQYDCYFNAHHIQTPFVQR